MKNMKSEFQGEAFAPQASQFSSSKQRRDDALDSLGMSGRGDTLDSLGTSESDAQQASDSAVHALVKSFEPLPSLAPAPTLVHDEDGMEELSDSDIEADIGLGPVGAPLPPPPLIDDELSSDDDGRIGPPAAEVSDSLDGAADMLFDMTIERMGAIEQQAAERMAEADFRSRRGPALSRDERRQTFRVSSGVGDNDTFYDHEATCDRYRAFLRGEIQHWDPADQQRHEELLAQDKPGLPPNNKRMSGVDVSMRGQSDDQLLEVRSDIRRSRSRNLSERRVLEANYAAERKRIDAAVALSSAAREAQFKQAGVPLQEFRARATEQFVELMFTGNAKLLPECASQSVTWLNEKVAPHEQTFTVPNMYGNLDTFGDMMMWMITLMNELFTFGHVTSLAVLTRVVMLNGMRWREALVAALCMIGPRSACKSYVSKCNAEIAPPGLCRTTAHKTALAATAAVDNDCVVTLTDEADGASLGIGDKQGSNQHERSLYKTMATEKRLATDALAMGDDGRRDLVRVVSSHIGTTIEATNVKVNTDTPEMARKICVEVGNVPADDYHAIENKVARIDDFLNDTHDELVTQLRLQSVYVMFVELAIAAGAIRDVNMDAFSAHLQRFNEEMANMGTPLTDPKSSVKVDSPARTLTIMHACHVVFCTEYSASWRFDADGTPRPLREILPRALQEVEKLLSCTMSESVCAFTLCTQLWSNPEWPNMCRSVAKIAKVDEMFAYESKESRSVQLFDPLVEKMKQSDWQQTLQKRINERCMNRLSEEEEGDLARNRRRLAKQASEQALANDGHDADDRLKQKQERIIQKYISKARTKLLCPIDDEGEQTIDPHYVEVMPPGNQSNRLRAVAELIRKSMDVMASVDNIITALQTMSKLMVESPVYTYNVRTNRIMKPKLREERTVWLPAVLMRFGSARNMMLREGADRSSVSVYVATVLLVDDKNVQSSFLAAISRLSFSHTLRRTLFTCIDVVAPALWSADTGAVHTKQRFPGLMQVVEIGPSKRHGTTVNFHAQTADHKAVAFVASRQRRWRGGGQKTALASRYNIDELNQNADAADVYNSTVFETTIDPDIVVGNKRAMTLGLPPSQTKRCTMMHVQSLLTDMRARLREKEPTGHFVFAGKYPDQPLRQQQLENVKLFYQRHAPHLLRSGDASRFMMNGSRLQLDRATLALMARFGGRQVVEKALGGPLGKPDDAASEPAIVVDDAASEVVFARRTRNRFSLAEDERTLTSFVTTGADASESFAWEGGGAASSSQSGLAALFSKHASIDYAKLHSTDSGLLDMYGDDAFSDCFKVPRSPTHAFIVSRSDGGALLNEKRQRTAQALGPADGGGDDDLCDLEGSSSSSGARKRRRVVSEALVHTSVETPAQKVDSTQRATRQRFSHGSVVGADDAAAAAAASSEQPSSARKGLLSNFFDEKGNVLPQFRSKRNKSSARKKRAPEAANGDGGGAMTTDDLLTQSSAAVDTDDMSRAFGL